MRATSTSGHGIDGKRERDAVCRAGSAGLSWVQTAGTSLSAATPIPLSLTAKPLPRAQARPARPEACGQGRHRLRLR
jgi:hypothetical protein